MSIYEDESPLDNSMISFKLLRSARRGPRVGQLLLRGRTPLDTPNFIGLTSRGVIPHLSQDIIQNHTNIEGAYVALEDFLERGFDHSSLLGASLFHSPNPTLRDFIALPDSQLLILGPRRNPPVHCPVGSGDSGISVNTSNGFRQLSSKEYVSAVQLLKPDIVIGLADIRPTAKASWRRTEKMTSRTENWTKEMLQGQEGASTHNLQVCTSFFAPLLPISKELQSWYIDILSNDLNESVVGLAIYDVDGKIDLTDTLQRLPCLCLDNLETPHRVLNGVSHGLDLMTIPFISLATDAGIALDFTFPALNTPNGVNTRRPLGHDMWSPSHATDLSPLAPGCECYACNKHHRAYVQHLLCAKEMLAWVLLQIHNHHVLDLFFRGIRESIAAERFERDCHTFHETYEPELPEKTGQGPRVRGYQHKSEGPGEPKKNAPAYRIFSDAAGTALDATSRALSTNAQDSER